MKSGTRSAGAAGSAAGRPRPTSDQKRADDRGRATGRVKAPAAPPAGDRAADRVKREG